MQASRWVGLAERGCLTILFAWLVWLPLPFGSVVEGARLPLVAVPLALGAVSAAIRIYVIRERNHDGRPTRAWTIWASGGLLLLAAGGLQLVPLPPDLLRILSPQAHSMWSSASRMASIAGSAAPAWWTLSVDPGATAAELLRMSALFAAFTTAAILVRTQVRRATMAAALCVAAVFESMYGLREAALQRYEIWGWVNRLVFDRVTGTFVNPNHFAHYLAIVLPMALFLGASLWRRAGGPGATTGRRFALLLEHNALALGLVFLAAMSCLAGILLSQSRGAMVALAASFLGLAALLPGRRAPRVVLASAAVLLVIATLALFLGPERTVRRFTALEENASSRRWSVATAIDLWQRFPLFGTGYGTFARVVSIEQSHDVDRIYNHAHNDYAELAATGGAIGFVIGVIALLGGVVSLLRLTFAEGSRELTWTRRAFQAAALLSIGVALVHACFDFNFFVPANPATLAAIAGAAMAPTNHDRRTRR